GGRRGAAEDVDVSDLQPLARGKADTVDAGVGGVAAVAEQAVEPNVTQGHDVGRLGGDVDSVGARDQGGRDLAAAAVEGDRLRDGHGAEAAGIERVDLAAVRRLRDGARPGLARRGAAAWIGVVADAGDPRARRLRERRRARQPKAERRSDKGRYDNGLAHRLSRPYVTHNISVICHPNTPTG